MSPGPSNSNNPYLTELIAGLEREGVAVGGIGPRVLWQADLVHLHWPDLALSLPSAAASYAGAAKLVGLAAACRLFRRPVVWTVHNLRPHEIRHRALDRLFWPVFTRLVSGYVSLTGAAVPLIERAHPGLRKAAHAVVPHGTYAGVYPSSSESARAVRERLVGATNLLFFGQVRPYKGVPDLLQAFASVGTVDGTDVGLAVAGECLDPQERARLERLATADGRVTLNLGRVPDAEVAAWFEATSGTVLPFIEGLNSGSVFLSLTMGRPVLVPRSAVFDELAGQVGSDWVQRYDDALTPDLLERFATSGARLVAAGGSPDLSAFAWPGLAAATAGFYRTLVSA